MDWINDYKDEVKKYKCIGGILLLFSIAMMVICIPVVTQTGNVMAGILALISLIALFPVSLFILFGVKITYRRYKDVYIALYFSGIKKYLIIDGEVQMEGEITQYSFYGQLDDGTEVVAKVAVWSGDVQFIIGTEENHNIRYTI